MLDRTAEGGCPHMSLPVLSKRHRLFSPVNRVAVTIQSRRSVKRQDKPRLIGSNFTAVIAVILNGYVAASTFRSAFSQHPHRFRWMLPFGGPLPHWAFLTANVALYASLIFLCVAFPIGLRGKERVLVAGWVPNVLLSPVQGLVSGSMAAGIQYFKAGSMMVAFLVAVAILLERPEGENSPVDGTIPE